MAWVVVVAVVVVVAAAVCVCVCVRGGGGAAARVPPLRVRRTLAEGDGSLALNLEELFCEYAGSEASR